MSGSSIEGVKVIARGLLTVTLMASVLAKVMSEHDERFFLPRWWLVVMVGLETSAAMLMWTRWSKSACAIILAIALGGLAIALVNQGRPCGCHGSWIRSAWGHATICCLLGILATISWPRRDAIPLDQS